MRRSSGRGQIEPIAALAAVLAVAAGLTLYAEALSGIGPDDPADGTAERALDRIERRLRTAGVVTPDALDGVDEAVPEGWRVNVTLTAGDRRWGVGTAPPPDARRAVRRVAIRDGSGQIDPGRLAVVLWR